MKHTFKLAGITYYRWEHDGKIYEAPKKAVKEFGKEFFYEELEYISEIYDTEPDGIFMNEENIQNAIARQYTWLRQEEIM